MSGVGKFLYDTDIIIDYLRGNNKAKELLAEDQGKQCISVITVAELYVGVRSDKEQEVIEKLTEYFEVVEINKEIAKVGGMFKRQYAKSHNVLLPDSLIAASAIYYFLELKTLNVKHYPMIENIKPAYLKD